ncbi:MAG: chemotaxis protein CheD [Clostridia bacterium]|nr:chemotaxis protein CheD [Clostridia bacterium]
MARVSIGLAEMQVVKPPDSIITYGLGSCVGLVLYDRTTKIAGMVHIVLPHYNKTLPNVNIAKCADTAVAALLTNMVKQGANRAGIIAKLAGGAHVFKGSNSPALMVGPKNIEVTKQMLQQLRIKLVAEDCGGEKGRTVEFFPDSGKYVIKVLGQGEKII